MTTSPTLSEGTPATAVPSRASIAGHPLHPAVVPFPIALLSAALVTDLAAQSSDDEFWPRASRYLLGAGLATGMTAGALGAVDYYGLERPRQVPEGRWHALGNAIAMTLTAGNLAVRRRCGRVPRSGLTLSAAVAGLLAVTGVLGGELSYRHLVGVDPKPEYRA